MKRPSWLARRPHGFTMLEMLIVVALIGIVATIALPNFRYSVTKAKEAVLKEDLWVLRDVIDQYHTDKGVYPPSLEELVTAGYIRRIPVDPITGKAEWDEVTEPLGEEQGDTLEQSGITDVRTFATGQALDGTFYTDW